MSEREILVAGEVIGIMKGGLAGLIETFGLDSE